MGGQRPLTPPFWHATAARDLEVRPGCSLPLKGGGLGWGSADSRYLPPATASPTLPLSGGGSRRRRANDAGPPLLQWTAA
jgi:hypothetical protein